MPELPEVETVRRGLAKYVVGKTLKEIEIIHEGSLQGEKSYIENQKIIAARRIGKGLILDFGNGYSIGIHIKLTGQLIYRDETLRDLPVSLQKVGTIPNKFTHVIFHFIDGAVMYYNDIRRFGWIKIIKTDELMSLPFFKAMGPEPFKDLTLQKFEEILRGKTTKIKPLIMDQSRIGGIGNIYANDALWRAKIDPRRAAKDISKNEAKELFDALIAVMEKSFEEGGASELSFVNILGQEGNYQRHSLVYAKTGKDCKRKDGGVIQRITLSGRGTFFCEECQH